MTDNIYCNITDASIYARGKERFRKTSILNRLDIELTERCNNNCIHCCINLPKDDIAAKEKELSIDSIKTILREAVSLGCMSVVFTGGEPLLREDFEEIYVFARKQGLRVVLFTNATLITRNIAKLFLRIPPLKKIQVSIYGMTAKSYEAVSGVKGSFDKAMQGVELLRKNKIPFIVKGVFLPQNKQEQTIFRNWALDIPWMEGKPPAQAIFLDMRLRRDSEQKNSRIKDLRVSSEEGLQLLVQDKESYIRSMREFCSEFTQPHGATVFSCGAGINGGCVDAYGYFYPCLMLKAPNTAYDLKKGSLKEALVDFFPKLRRTKAANAEYVRRCAKCFLKGLCEQCPAKAWTEHGALDAPVEYFCGIAHAQARVLGLLDATEKAWNVKNWQERLKNFYKKGDSKHGCKN